MSSTDPSTGPSPDEVARLRALLHDAVPEAPDVAPTHRPRRSPRPALVVLAAAAAVAAIAVVPIVVTGDEQAQESGPDPAAVTLPADPWTADPCPERTSPPARRTTEVVPDLSAATTIRLCALDTQPGDEALLTDFLVPDDALLTGFDDLQAAVDELPTARDTCATIDWAGDPYRTSLVVEAADGPEVLAADLCTELVVRDADGSERRVAAGAVADAVVDALGEQRRAADYPPFRFTLFDTQVPTFCSAPPTLAPVAPRESGLAVAVVCPGHNVDGDTPRPLGTGSDGLDDLDGAWRRTSDPAVDDAFDGYDDEQASVVALTSQGDLVRMVPREGVDGLTLVVPRQTFGWGPTSEVPITLDDLVDR